MQETNYLLGSRTPVRRVTLRPLGPVKTLENKQIEQERRSASIVVLVLHHLASCGYTQSVCALEKESGIKLGKFSPADNIDLTHVVKDFETYFELKYDRRPRLVNLGHKDSLPSEHQQPTDDSRRAKSKLQPLRKLPAILPSVQNSNTTLVASPTLNDDTNVLEMSVTGTSFQGSTSAPKPQENEKCVEPCLAEGDANADSWWTGCCPANPIIDTEIAVDLARASADLPNGLDEVVGLEDAKKVIKEAVVYPIKYPKFFEPRSLFSPWRGLLLFGSPGTGKTLLARAVAAECSASFFHVTSSAITSKWRGESEKLVRAVFDAARARAPSVVFVDEIECVVGGTTRSGSSGSAVIGTSNLEHDGTRRMRAELLTQLDGLLSGGGPTAPRVLFLAASNAPWELDPAILRRLEKRVHVPMPCAEARAEILKRYLPVDARDANSALLVDPDIDFIRLARISEGYSGSDLRVVAREALMQPLRKILKTLEASELAPSLPPQREMVSTFHVEQALCSSRPANTNSASIRRYHDWGDLHGSV